ncbi:sensor histidine kinase [Phenylobacterium sp.]|uniref:sensor histidine kinase n=1 Tax=Phenylobacterium sp. TaxID=1871053 RepID=UPI0025EA9415|nr:PAS domain-containing sensor histidine kinase [Phenylobacterium sp.]
MAEAIVNTIHEPFLVLDEDLRVMAASRSFYQTFKVDPEQTQGSMLYALGDGQWDIPALRILLETIIPEHTAMDDFEVVHDFPKLGRRTMLLNARKVIYETSPVMTILLAFTDVTERRAIELEKAELLARTEDLLRQKNVLLQEMEHRVANSLQIIASILQLKARAVSSEETRGHLRDAHQRVMSVAAVQSHLYASDGIDQIEVGAYLFKLCSSLATSMIGEDQPIKLKVVADNGKLGSAQAVSIGLIVTELVINALKYAFPVPKPRSEVLVTYESDGADWKLVVSDNGVGKQVVTTAKEAKGGLGTVIVTSLVKQLDARMELVSSPAGLAVTVTRAPFTARLPAAA